MKRILFALFCIISFEANAQNLGDTLKKDFFTAPDTVKHLHSKFLALIPPAALITYGALSFAINPIRRFDYYINSEIQKSDPDFHSKAESYFQFAPVALVYGLNLVGVEGKNRFIDRTALLTLSAGILGVADFTLKHTTHRLRPNQGDYYSFPSGHTSTAFAGAEFMAQEYSGKSAWYGVAGYAIAATTGIFRMYNHDHWFSDVVAGAGFGILSTKAAYLVYPYLRNALTHKDKNGKATLIMPSYQDGAIGMVFTKQL
jgi:membrane-associated phospholipid phosphatase